MKGSKPTENQSKIKPKGIVIMIGTRPKKEMALGAGMPKVGEKKKGSKGKKPCKKC